MAVKGLTLFDRFFVLVGGGKANERNAKYGKIYLILINLGRMLRAS